MPLDAGLTRRLSAVSTATLTTVLMALGIRRSWMKGPRAIGRPARVVGPAFTLRFVPAREDLATPASWSSPRSTRAAIEAMPPGVITVVDAMGVTDAGIFGDLLCMRMVRRGVSALITDGALRDMAGVRETGLPVWAAAAAAPASVAALTFVGWQEPIGCGGTAVFPDDIIVADEDGAVVIPAALVHDVLTRAEEHERQEAWILGEISRDVPLPGLYPPDAATLDRYRRETGNDG